MSVYYTPGVYFEKIDTGRERISWVRTDVPGFVGIAEKGPLNKAIRLESWKQFQSVFGSFIPQSYLAYAVNGFFENEGNTCYVVRIADLDSAKKAGLILLDKNGNKTLKMVALNEGQWGKKIKVSLKETSMGSTSTVELMYECTSCGYIYDNGEESIQFEELSDEWGCPDCNASKEMFNKLSKQPPNRSFSFVKSIIGFEKGSLVKVFQNQGGITTEHYHCVDAIDTLSKKIIWGVSTPLETVFNLTNPIYFSTLEFTLTFSLGDEIKEIFENLSINPGHSRYFAKDEKEERKIVNGLSNLVTIEDMNSPSLSPQDKLPDPMKIVKGCMYLEEGTDGTSTIDRDDFVGDPSSEEKKGLRCYEDIDEVSMISIPDIMIQPVDIEFPPPPEKSDPCAPPEEESEFYSPEKPESSPLLSEDDIERVQTAMIEHCELLKDRVAILDPPFNLDIPKIHEWRQKLNSKYAVLYYPWITVNDPLRLKGNITRLIPPSGHIAGVYARTDLTKGVHKAPANEELLGTKDTALIIEDAEQDILNPVGINCLRFFRGKGVLIWGTRTISRDPIWRYINIRRLLIMIEESVEEAMQWAVFESNNAHLRNSIKVAVSSFLEELWRKGALAGETTNEAFFVKCDEENNPQYVVDAGQIITDIGVAPSIPGEFIILRIGKVKDGIEIIKEGV